MVKLNRRHICGSILNILSTFSGCARARAHTSTFPVRRFICWEFRVHFTFISWILLLYNFLDISPSRTTTVGYCPVFLSSQEMGKMKVRLTGSQLRVVERSVAPTPSTKLWSWRRSSSSICTWRGSAVWRSAAACTSPTGRSKSGSKTGGWNWKKWPERTESESSPTALASHETAWACGPPPSMVRTRVKSLAIQCENVKMDPRVNLFIVVYFRIAVVVNVYL